MNLKLLIARCIGKRDNNFNLSYDCFEKAGILNRHFCSVSDLNDRNKDLPPFVSEHLGFYY
jgi:hypothetical protein